MLGRAVQKVADSIMMTLIGNDAMYIYNVSWVSLEARDSTHACLEAAAPLASCRELLPCADVKLLCALYCVIILDSLSKHRAKSLLGHHCIAVIGILLSRTSKPDVW